MIRQSGGLLTNLEAISATWPISKGSTSIHKFTGITTYDSKCTGGGITPSALDGNDDDGAISHTQW